MARVLVVEDNEMNREMLCRRLRRTGHDVMTASDGLEALVVARARRPDIILMDLRLPRMDGWEATRRLKADHAMRAIPVIALTAHAMRSDRDEAIAAGCDDYDSKPIDLPRLLGKIAMLLSEDVVA